VNNFFTLAARRADRTRHKFNSACVHCLVDNSSLATRPAATSNAAFHGSHQRENGSEKVAQLNGQSFCKSYAKNPFPAGAQGIFCTKPSVGVFTANFGGFPY